MQGARAFESPGPVALFDAMQAGANGFLTKAIPLRKLIRSTRAVLRGETIVPPAMLGHLLSQLVENRSEQNKVMRRLSRLTRREREVLALLVEGGDNDLVANRLVISPETARTHIQNILGKLDVHSRLEALSLVLRKQHRTRNDPELAAPALEIHLVHLFKDRSRS